MRVVPYLVLSLFLSQFAFAGEAALKAKMDKLKLLQDRVTQECINNKNAANYRVTIEKETYTCPQLIVITNRLANKLDIDMEKFAATCAANNKKSQIDLLASQTAELADKAVACTPSPDQKQCFSKFSCGMLAATAPIKYAMAFTASALNSASLKQCSAQGSGVPGCLLNIMKGIFDSIWSTLELIWDIGKYATVKGGEFLGIIKTSEAKTSEKAMLAQQAGPGFLKRLMTDPVGTLQVMTKNFYDSLEESAINHYGCQKWSGLPFGSTCLQPMTNWKCGSCQQKAQVYCGIAGYAIGEIGTSFLTGGIVAGGKAAFKGAVKLGSGPSKNVAAFIGKKFPKSTAEVAKATAKVKAMAQVTFTVAQKALLVSWEAIKNNKASQIIAKAASKVSSSVAVKAASFALKPIGAYLKAMDKAFMSGFNIVDTGFKGGNKVVTEEAIKGAKIADEAMEVAPQSAVAPQLVISSSTSRAPTAASTAAATSKTIQRAETNLASRAPETAEIKATTAEKAEGKVAATAEEKALDAEAAAMIQETKNAPELIIKYGQDPEYASLFKVEKSYPEQHRDLALVIRDMEKRNPKMSKADIRKDVEKYVKTCEL